VDEKHALELFLSTRTEESFCVLFEMVYPRVRRYFLVRAFDSMTAEELAQNVLLKVYTRSSALRERELFNGWLFKIARNEMLAYWRRIESSAEIVEFEPIEHELAEELLTRVEQPESTRFDEWMGFLEPAEREVARLRFVDELSYEEMTFVLGVPMGTVKWRLFNIKKKLTPVIKASTERDRRSMKRDR
jgi:RNA polymerase sigma-70 factor (ECF subfamily)